MGSGKELLDAQFPPMTARGRGAIIGDMKQELMNILACPVCKGKLELRVTEENAREIVTGSLHCAKCQATYPITDTIPNLLPPAGRD